MEVGELSDGDLLDALHEAQQDVPRHEDPKHRHDAWQHVILLMRELERRYPPTPGATVLTEPGREGIEPDLRCLRLHAPPQSPSAAEALVMWNVVTVSLRQAIVPDHVLGRLNSSYRLLAWRTMPAGAAIAGLGAELMGARGIFAVFAAASILLLVPILTVTDARIEATQSGVQALVKPVGA